jgi:hypothetical protein
MKVYNLLLKVSSIHQTLILLLSICNPNCIIAFAKAEETEAAETKDTSQATNYLNLICRQQFVRENCLSFIIRVERICLVVFVENNRDFEFGIFS